MPLIDRGAAQTLADAGVSVIGHEFVRDRAGRERLAVRLETVDGVVLVHDDPGGIDPVHVALADDPNSGPTGLDGWGTPELSAALLALAEAGAMALRARLADMKEQVAADVVSDLLIDLAEVGDDPTGEVLL